MPTTSHEAVPGSRTGGRAFTIVLLSLGGLLLLFVSRGALGIPGASSNGDPGATELDRARWETEVLRMEAELASVARPYLVLDLSRSVLTLKFQAVTLREYPLLGSLVRARHGAPSWGSPGARLDSIWAGGSLAPRVHRKREVIYSDSVTPPDPSGTVESIPPTPEEAVPSPPSFKIRFSGGLSVAVFPVSLDPTGKGAAGSEEQPFRLHPIHWLRLKPWLRDLARIDLKMSEAEAGSLYRAFSDGTPLLVLRPAPGSAGNRTALEGGTT